MVEASTAPSEQAPSARQGVCTLACDKCAHDNTDTSGWLCCCSSFLSLLSAAFIYLLVLSLRQLVAATAVWPEGVCTLLGGAVIAEMHGKKLTSYRVDVPVRLQADGVLVERTIAHRWASNVPSEDLSELTLWQSTLAPIGTEVPCWYTWVDDSSELLGTAALTYAVKLSEGTPEGATGGMRTLVAVLALTLILLWTCALCYGCVLCESWRSAYVSLSPPPSRPTSPARQGGPPSSRLESPVLL